MTKQRLRWTDEENALLRELWKSSMKIDVLAGHFPGRKHFTVYEHARRVLNLPARRIPQPFDDLLTWRQISEHLAKHPATAKEISIATGILQSTVTGLLNSRRGRSVHVSSYARQIMNGIPVRVWSLGEGKDAPKPKALTDTERKRKYMKRLRKEEPERIELWAEKNRVRKQANAGKLARRDAAASWI